MLRPTTIEELQEAVRESERLLLRGGGTKPALSTPADGVTPVDLTGVAGVVEYSPSEFTFTALAGTRLAEVQAMLAERGQYLPFDPPLAAQGATLGGCVAAGLSGPGRYRYGGVRDFILGVRVVDGQGEVVRGGGKVVKNAAGFDLPKLMVGSLGQFGALVELTFKVFPQAPANLTVQRRFASLKEAIEILYYVYTARLDVEALDLAPDGGGPAVLWVRLGGLPDALPARAERMQALVGGGDVLAGEDEARLWNEMRDFLWAPSGWTLVKVPLTPRRILTFDACFQDGPSIRRYSAGGNVAWLASPVVPAVLDQVLASQGLAGLVLMGPPGQARIGTRSGQAFERRVKEVFDPAGKFA